MRRRGNRGRPLSGRVELCLAAVLLSAAPGVAGAGGWDCRQGSAEGWRCVGAAGPVAGPPVLSAVSAEPDMQELPGGGAAPSAEPAAPAGQTPVQSSSPPVAPAVTRSDLAESLWVPRGELAPERAVHIPEFCGGAYRTFAWPLPVGTEPEGYPIHATSLRAAYLMDGDMELSGDVHLEQGNRTVHAARARIDQVTREGTVTGGVRVQEPGLVMQGKEAQVNLDTHAATVDDVAFVLLDSDMRGEARRVAQDADGNLVMTRGTFTRCEPGNNNWRISASSVDVPEGEVFGTARNAVLRVREVPVFYVPYIKFPVTDDRQSGWLFPNVAYSDEDGYDVSVPYYLNLAPNYDATLLPRYVSQRGPGMEGQFRYLSGWQESTVSAAFLHQDDLYNGEVSRDDFQELAAEGSVTGEFDPEDRWLYAMDHLGAFGNFATAVDYTAVSDRDYFRHLGSDLGVSSQIELERRGEIRYAAGGFEARLWAQRFQRLDENPVEPYQRLPELDLIYSGDLPGALRWSVGSSLVTFTRENDDLSGLGAAVGDRVHVEPRLQWPISAPWGYVTLTGGYRYTRYDLRDVPAAVDPEPERTIGFGSARGGLFFERDLRWFDTDLVQTLEPEVFYLYQEFENQDALPRFDTTPLTFSYSQLFRDNRFAGFDRIGDANQTSMGVTTRFLNPRNGQEYLRASAGGIYYFRDRRVTLTGAAAEEQRESTSALAGELAARVADGWSATGSLVWDPHGNQWQETAIGIQYRGDDRHIFNIGFRKRLEADVEQTDLSLYWPVSRHYGLIGRWNYDVVSGRTVEGFAGVEYNDCCWRIRLLARRFLDSPTGRNLDTVEADEGILLQIVFKGLAGFGDKMESVLRRGIRGYRTETTYDD